MPSAHVAIGAAFQTHLAAGGDPSDFNTDPLFDGVDASELPSLNAVPLDQIEPGSLVRFRCMVQDTFDPEFYLDVYETVTVDGTRDLRCGRYRDTGELGPGGEIDHNSPHTVMHQRQTLYCVPIPAETEWVKLAADGAAAEAAQAEAAEAAAAVEAKPEAEVRAKRNARDMDDEEEEEVEAFVAPEEVAAKRTREVPLAAEGAADAAGPAAAEGEGEGAAAVSFDPSQYNFNFPLPGETGPAVMVKMYTEDVPRIAQMIEVIGVYEIDAAVGVIDAEEDPYLAEEIRAHHPPPSMIPRIHCLAVELLTHNNPHIPQQLSEEVHADMVKVAEETRAALIEQIGCAMKCSDLVAEYVLLALVASVHSRQEENALVLGKLGLNIFGLNPDTHPAVEALTELLSGLLPSMFHLPLNLDTLNTITLNPRKNTGANRLEAGSLQLSDGTLLLLDECVMEEGKLNAQGVRNITALGHLIMSQTLTYEFEWTPLTFETNLRTIVFSEGKSMLPSDVHIPMLLEPERPDAPEVSAEGADILRGYITAVRMLPHTIEDEVKEVIAADFVKMRQTSKDTMGSTLHMLLSIARLVSVSRCETSLTVDSWHAACALEDARRAAVAEATPAAPGAATCAAEAGPAEAAPAVTPEAVA